MNKETIKQFLKFGIVGGINTIISYLLTNLFYYVFSLNEQLCNLLVFIITVYISFYLNGKYVFKSDEKEGKSFLKSLLKVYASYSITGLFLTGILLYVEEQLFGIPHYIATLMNLIVTIPLNFILNKFWSFK